MDRDTLQTDHRMVRIAEGEAMAAGKDAVVLGTLIGTNRH